MLIRAEQMIVFEGAAEENFGRRLAAHLLERYAKTIVRFPEDKQSPVDELPHEILHSLVRNSIEHARRYGLNFESSVAAFTALRFEVSPNFDKHRLCQILLKDENAEPNARLDELLEVLNEKNWETIRDEYDVNAWESKTEEATDKPDVVENLDFAETVTSAEDAKKPQNSDFDKTVMNFENQKKSEKSDNDEDFNFLDTIKY